MFCNALNIRTANISSLAYSRLHSVSVLIYLCIYSAFKEIPSLVTVAVEICYQVVHWAIYRSRGWQLDWKGPWLKRSLIKKMYLENFDKLSKERAWWEGVAGLELCRLWGEVSAFVFENTAMHQAEVLPAYWCKLWFLNGVMFVWECSLCTQSDSKHAMSYYEVRQKEINQGRNKGNLLVKAVISLQLSALLKK